MIGVGRFATEIQASAAKMLLEGSGINVVVRRDDCSGWEPCAAGMNSIKLFVLPCEKTRAEELLRQIDSPS